MFTLLWFHKTYVKHTFLYYYCDDDANIKWEQIKTAYSNSLLQ